MHNAEQTKESPPVTATYEYLGGSQSKQFSLTIVREDMPPTFPANGPADGLWHGNDLYIDGFCGSNDPGTTITPFGSFGVYGADNDVVYSIIGDDRPADLTFDGEHFHYTLTTADAYKVFQFDI